MDFDRAAARLASDQRKSRRTARSKPVGLGVSAKARREAEERRKRTAERLAAQRRERSKLTYAVRYMDRCDGWLGVNRSLGRSDAAVSGAGFGLGGGASAIPASSAAASAGGATSSSTSQQQQPTWNPRPSLLLRPTSIHGDGDKLSLPPSVLATLAESGLVGGTVEGGQQPLAFRVGILNPNYQFPSSQAVKNIMERAPIDKDSGDVADSDTDDSDVEDSDGGGRGDHAGGEDGKAKRKRPSRDTEAYLEELSHKYLSYTHATVVEFTMEEGQVGLPEPVSSALLDNSTIARKRTVDPASVSSSNAPPLPTEGDSDADMEAADDAGEEAAAKANEEIALPMQIEDGGEKTPGHIAWGLFDVPDVDVEITLIKLPKGKNCTLVPTPDAVRNGFYNLKDIKLVLEQSLIRTRATLSVSDCVHTWHRGKKFDLMVKDVTPSGFGAVSCINTDIEVDFSAPEGMQEDATSTEIPKAKESEAKESSSFAPGTGYKLSDGPPKSSHDVPSASSQDQSTPAVDLPDEPPAEQKDNVCTVQIRGDGATGRRRFDIQTTTMRDLFAFASASCNLNDLEGQSFRLVTRFPRRVFEDSNDTTLEGAGIGQGQEMFMVERL